MSTHWIDRHFSSPQERAAAILADEDRRAREARGRLLRWIFVIMPLAIVTVALIGTGAAAALHYHGVVDLTAYAPWLPRRAPAEIAASPVLEAAPGATSDLSALILAPGGDVRPTQPPSPPERAEIFIPTRAPGEPVSSAHADHLRQGIALLGREMVEVDGGITGYQGALYVRPWPSDGGRPAPWTDAEHLAELEAYWRHSRLNDGQVWEYRRAHDAWVANVENDRKRLRDLTEKKRSLTARQANAKAELSQ
jgi:hypothetical protein